jgi:hypothetical protein
MDKNEKPKIGKNMGNAGKGRPKGAPNKATALAREAIANFVDGNADKLQGWLDDIAADKGSLAAFQCFTDLLEYHVPKLSRAEVTGKDGGNLTIEIVKYADCKDS